MAYYNDAYDMQHDNCTDLFTEHWNETAPTLERLARKDTSGNEKEILAVVYWWNKWIETHAKKDTKPDGTHPHKKLDVENEKCDKTNEHKKSVLTFHDC